MSEDVFVSGVFAGFALGLTFWIVFQGLAWIVNLARHMLIGDD
jgi:hypothetical protein